MKVSDSVEERDRVRWGERGENRRPQEASRSGGTNESYCRQRVEGERR